MYVGSLATADDVRRTDMALKPFPFTALPGEIRHQIYRQYLGSWDAIIEYDRKSARFVLGGQPEYNLMLTNRTTHLECRYLVPKSFSGRLVLRDAKIRRENGFGYVSSFDEITTLCPSWLLRKTEVISINQGTTGMLMSLPWQRLDSVKEVHLESNSLPIAYYHPRDTTSSNGQSQWQHILDGVYDTWCLNGHNKWSQVPQPILIGKVRVLTSRRGSVQGVSLNIWVEHRSECAEVVCRMVEPLG